MNAPTPASSLAAPQVQAPSMDEETTLTYRQITECQIRGGLEALDSAIENLVAERKDAQENGKNAPDALTLLRQQRSAYVTHLFIERISAKTGWKAV